MAISLSAITLINRVPENCRLPKIVPQTDKKAYKKYPKYAQWYDRYLVMKDQGTMVGLFNEDPVEKYYPIFVKPRINLEGFNKDCHLFETPEDFNKFRDGLSEKKKTELFWSVFLPGPEGSTDLILHNGDIKMGFHMTATSSTDKHEYLEYGRDIEFIPEYNLNKIPKWILDWTNNHLQGFTGIVNIQYRRDKIIEVSYRPDGGGRFWMILEWPELMQTLDKLYKENKWIEPENEPEVRKYYVRKPIIPKPLILTPMLFVLDILVRSLGIKYWYPYTEPGYKETNLAGIIDKDKKKAENVANIIVIFYFIYVFIYFGLVLYWLTYGRKIINERLKLQEYFWYIGIVLLLSIPYLPKFFPRFVLFQRNNYQIHKMFRKRLVQNIIKNNKGDINFNMQRLNEYRMPFDIQSLQNKLNSEMQKTMKISDTFLHNKDSLNKLVQDSPHPVIFEIGHIDFFYKYHILLPFNQFQFNQELTSIFDSMYNLPHMRISQKYPSFEQQLEDLVKSVDKLNVLIDYIHLNLFYNDDSYIMNHLIETGIRHHQMHNEVLIILNQQLGLNLPFFYNVGEYPIIDLTISDIQNKIQVKGNVFNQGGNLEQGFHWDNELPSFKKQIKDFKVSQSPLTKKDWLELIENQNFYTRKDCWSVQGQNWKERFDIRKPRYWIKRQNNWYEIEWGKEHLLEGKRLKQPMLYISAFEAEAAATLNGGRLPTESEYEYMLKTQNIDYLRNYGWMWTTTSFHPYVGYSIDPIYQTFSYPWFYERQVIRGNPHFVTEDLATVEYRNAQEPWKQFHAVGCRIVWD